MSSVLWFDKFFYSTIVILFLNIYSSDSGIVTKNRKWALVKTANTVQVTALECHELDKPFATFALCTLKPISRTLKQASVRVVLHKPPVTKSTIRIKFWKRANGYKPFGIDVYFEVCKFLAGKNNIVFDWMYSIILPYTNINHTCPYYSDMIVDKVPLGNISLPSVFPEGMYRLDLTFSVFNIQRALVNIYLKIDEKDYVV